MAHLIDGRTGKMKVIYEEGDDITDLLTLVENQRADIEHLRTMYNNLETNRLTERGQAFNDGVKEERERILQLVREMYQKGDEYTAGDFINAIRNV